MEEKGRGMVIRERERERVNHFFLLWGYCLLLCIVVVFVEAAWFVESIVCCCVG